MSAAEAIEDIDEALTEMATIEVEKVSAVDAARASGDRKALDTACARLTFIRQAIREARRARSFLVRL